VSERPVAVWITFLNEEKLLVNREPQLDGPFLGGVFLHDAQCVLRSTETPLLR